MYDVEIKPREILASVTIIAVMLLIGFVIAGKISEHQMDTQEKYNKATKIETSEIFKYGMDTSIGNAFVYGDLKTIDPVTYPEIDGKHLFIKKVKEIYTRHTRTVTTTVNGKTHTRTEVYWTWDYAGSEEKKAKFLTFLGVQFKTSQFNLPSSDHIETINKSSDIRYKYYSIPTDMKGTIFAYLEKGNINKDGAKFYDGMTIKETTESLDTGLWLGLFWIFWIPLTGLVVYLFYYLDNNWLD